MHDLLIIGSGPAGVSAALSASARDLDFLWFGQRSLSRKIERAGRIMNYPGLPAVTGAEMRDAFLRQIDGLGISILEERVNAVYEMGGSYTALVNDKMYEGKTVILATGVSGSREIPGESRLLGRGVSYCATCDGALYRGKRIAVVCTEPSLEREVEFLAGLAAGVLLCTSYQDCSINRDNVRHVVGYPTEILGENRATGIVCGGETAMVDGVFCLRSSVAPAALLPGLAAEGGHIQVDRLQRTNLPGCFAAGDCTGRPYQYVKAAGEGNVALHSAVDYLKAMERPAK